MFLMSGLSLHWPIATAYSVAMATQEHSLSPQHKGRGAQPPQATAGSKVQGLPNFFDHCQFFFFNSRNSVLMFVCLFSKMSPVCVEDLLYFCLFCESSKHSQRDVGLFFVLFSYSNIQYSVIGFTDLKRPLCQKFCDPWTAAMCCVLEINSSVAAAHSPLSQCGPSAS